MKNYSQFFIFYYCCLFLKYSIIFEWRTEIKVGWEAMLCTYDCISLCESGWRWRGKVGFPLVNKLSFTTVLSVGIADWHVTGLKRPPQFIEFYYEIPTFCVLNLSKHIWTILFFVITSVWRALRSNSKFTFDKRTDATTGDFRRN